MPIKSLDELRALRVSLQKQVDLREKGESTEDVVEILVGMGTCGIAAGARDTFNKLLAVIEERNLNAKVISVGCVGFCHMEPTIQVNLPNEEPVIYGKITEDKVKELVETVVVQKKLMDENYLIKSFGKAVL